MMFQLFGIPSLNQKAREVPPFPYSLTTSGLFLLMARTKLFFWIGGDFFSCYLKEQDWNQQDTLISEELLSKLI